MKVRRIQLSRLRLLGSIAGIACTIAGLIFFVSGLTPPISFFRLILGTVVLLGAIFFSYWQAKVAVLRRFTQETIFVLSLIVSVNAVLVLLGTAVIFLRRWLGK